MHFIIRRLYTKKMADQFTFLILFTVKVQYRIFRSCEHRRVSRDRYIRLEKVRAGSAHRTARRANGQNQITERGLFASHPRERPAETYKPFPRIRIRAILPLALARSDRL